MQYSRAVTPPQRPKLTITLLPRPLLAELRSFSTPPPEVHKALIASYLLLGEKKKDVDKWKEVVIMLGKKNRLKKGVF